jgi:hypothetical protein
LADTKGAIPTSLHVLIDSKQPVNQHACCIATNRLMQFDAHKKEKSHLEVLEGHIHMVQLGGNGGIGGVQGGAAKEGALQENGGALQYKTSGHWGTEQMWSSTSERMRAKRPV